MCEPTTIALAATVASTAVGAYGAYTQAKTQKAVAENNANTAEMKAQDAQRRGEQAAQEARHRGMLIEGAQRASMSARGLDLAEGTPNDILGQTDFFTQSDQATARTNGRREAWSDRAQKNNFQAEANSISPGLTLAGSLLGGGSKVADKWYSYSKPGKG